MANFEAKIIKESEIVKVVEYSKCYYGDPTGGYAFPCDKEGNIFMNDLSDAAKENLEWCETHLEKFYRPPFVHKETYSYREPALMQCSCGEQFGLVNEYYGACDCPRCGQWYNLMGQHILPPEQWEDQLEDDY